ncbi:hypothetical protein [Hyphomicrobium sp. CS1GBMeth3]|uniref:hypothetical protein n=1 Tax=Hyphomicrobium sp. CS1GBMeth3 TaxID=1892845 RepID=UPI00092FE91F|nr:hypothetical protein [Hyphomicrobium sp. CS1GBMeth3]
MMTFVKYAAQGEIMIRRVGDVPSDAALPEGYTALAPEQGLLIVGHSETGHHHVIDASHGSVAVMDRPPEGMRILRAIITDQTPLTHLRDTDTHQPLMLEPGEYELRIAREYDPYEKLARQVAD